MCNFFFFFFLKETAKAVFAPIAQIAPKANCCRHGGETSKQDEKRVGS